MIRVEYDRSKPELLVHGHAGFAPAGQDIVCAAVSGCLYTVLAMLPEHPRMDVRWAAGNARIFVPGARARRVLDQGVSVLEEIARQYPDHVTVKRR